jgi:isoamylase
MDRFSAALAQGRSFPLGATLCAGGVNFSVFSKHCTGVELCLFDRVDDISPTRVIALDPRIHRTYHYWHAFVPGVGPGQIYAYRAHGPFDPAKGLRFDPGKTLLDPYGKCVARPVGLSREAARKAGDNAATDICRPRDAPVVQSPTYQVQSRSVVILFATAGEGSRSPISG